MRSKVGKMNRREREISWIKRVEDLVEALNGSTVGELELREGGTEIIIRRRPDMMLVSTTTSQVAASQSLMRGSTKPIPTREERSQPVTAPLTGVYYASPSPSLPPFVNLGDVIHVGQVVALVEAMKVFNEIQSEIAGRVVGLPAKNGEVIQKGQALLKIEPL